MKAPKGFLAVVLAALLLGGCATIHQLALAGRVLPQIEDLNRLQDSANQDGTRAQYELCGKDEDESALLLSIARNMGWKLERQDGRCKTVSYRKK